MTFRNKQEFHQRAFTLVELLVVIVIIATLATLGFIAARKAMDSAIKSKTVANMRQIASAAQVFSAENNGMLVDVQGSLVNGVRLFWAQHLLATMNPDLQGSTEANGPKGDAFARSIGIFTEPKALKKARDKLPSTGWRSWCTFTYNRQIGSFSPDEFEGNPKNEPGAKFVHQVEFPSKLLIAAQTNHAANPQGFEFSMAPDVLPKIDFEIYNGLAPVVFFDTHVEMFSKANFPVPNGKKLSTNTAYTEDDLKAYWRGTLSDLSK